MIAVGIDPDTKTTGVALVEWDGVDMRVLGVRLVRAKGRKVQDRLVEMASELMYVLTPDLIPSYFLPQEPDAVVVEWMKLRPKKEKNPNSILDLNGISGMCVAASVQLFPDKIWTPRPPIFTPIPSEWKKQVPKNVHQSRILSRVRLTKELTYDSGIVVPGGDKIPASMRTHVIDAIGLAMWALEPYGAIYQAQHSKVLKARR